MNETELRKILEKHIAYLKGEVGGERADLSVADLRGANLRGANLSGANGTFTTYYSGRDHGIAAGGYISIGCERHPYQHWLDHGVEIGRKNGYTDDEIERYMGWITQAVRWLSAEEEKNRKTYEPVEE